MYTAKESRKLRRGLYTATKSKSNATKAEKTNPPSRSDSRVSWAVSVEEYFAHGMEQYRLELEAARQTAEAENAENQTPLEEVQGPVRTPSWGVLGDALNLQLKHLEMITRSTQTDWTWLTMAVRWRHARTISSSLPPRPLPETKIVYDFPYAGHLSTRFSDSKIKRRQSKIVMQPPLPYTPKYVDKCVDTIDLEFNPYEPKLRITETKEQKAKFIAMRLSLLILRWRNKARTRLDGRKVIGRGRNERFSSQTSGQIVIGRAGGIEKPSNTFLDKFSLSSVSNKSTISDGGGEKVPDEESEAGEARPPCFPTSESAENNALEAQDAEIEQQVDAEAQSTSPVTSERYQSIGSVEPEDFCQITDSMMTVNTDDGDDEEQGVKIDTVNTDNCDDEEQGVN